MSVQRYSSTCFVLFRVQRRRGCRPIRSIKGINGGAFLIYSDCSRRLPARTKRRWRSSSWTRKRLADWISAVRQQKAELNLCTQIYWNVYPLRRNQAAPARLFGPLLSLTRTFHSSLSRRCIISSDDFGRRQILRDAAINPVGTHWHSPFV